MARKSGCYPTWKLGTIGSICMYVAASSSNPILRESILPITGTVAIVYMLLRRERNTPPTTMNDVSTTFMGIFYFGYMPAHWVRLRQIGIVPRAQLLPAVLPAASRAWRWPWVPYIRYNRSSSVG